MALRDHHTISRKRREQVQRAAKEMGYRPDPFLSSLAVYRRKNSPVKFQSTIAWINHWEQPEHLRKLREFDAYWRGAKDAAERFGYLLDEIRWSADCSAKRFEKILLTRGIRGVLIPPHLTKPDWGNLDWNKFSIVRFGMSVSNPDSNLVTANQFRAVTMAGNKIYQYGYRRIGLVVGKGLDENVGANFLGGFSWTQDLLGLKPALPSLNSGTAVLAKTNIGGYHVVGGNISSGSDLVLNDGVVRIAPGGNGDQLFNNRTMTINGGSFDMNGQTELTLGFAFGNGDQAYSGTMDGAVAIIKGGGGVQTLSADSTYTGNTTINGGTLAVSGSISNSALINIAGSATLDVTGRGDQTLTLNTNQILMGNGGVNGNLVTLPGSTVNPGASVGTLIVTNNITLGGTLLLELNHTNAQPSDKLLSDLGTITYGGTLSVTNIGPALQVGDSFQLFPSAVSAFTAISIATNDATGSIYTWNNKVASDGSIEVTGVVSPINPNPAPITFSVSGNTLKLSWPGDHKGWTLETNSVGLTVANQWFPYPGSTSVTNVDITLDSSKTNVFFRMVLP
jgi:autotransporter-associated beta strand protein